MAAFAFENIPYGHWIVKEISSPALYTVSPQQHHIYIGVDGQRIEIKVENTPDPRQRAGDENRGSRRAFFCEERGKTTTTPSCVSSTARYSICIGGRQRQ